MRRYPIFILVDSSKNVEGIPSELIIKDIKNLIDDLKESPYALELVTISVISFGEVPKIIFQSSDINSFNIERLKLIKFSGKRKFNECLIVLKDEVNNNCKHSDYISKDFDCRPLIIVFIGGDSLNWVDNSNQLLSCLQKYTKPMDIEADINNGNEIESIEQIKESIILCSFNQKVIELYSELTKSSFIIGENDLYHSVIKSYYYNII